MAQSKYFPNLTNGVDVADVEQIESAFSAVEEDMNAKISDITDGAVTTSKIADGAVTSDKMASGVIPTKTSDLENDEEYLKSADAVGKKGTGEGAEVFNYYTSKKYYPANSATGDYAHAEGYTTTASGTAAHAEGYGAKAEGDASHAEGMDTVATKQGSHAEGLGTTSSGHRAHAEGYSTVASGDQSHAEGYGAKASAESSHAEGTGTTASSTDQHVQGRWNIDDKNNKYAHIVGNGHQYAADPAVLSNAHTLDWEGTGWFANGVKVGGTGQDDELAKDVATEEYVDTKLAEKADAYTISSSVTGNTLLLADKTDTQLTSAAVATLTLTLPETIPAAYECFFSFKSGATATSITAPSNIKWAGADCNASKQFVPMPDTVYEVGIRRIGTDADGSAVICARVGAC